MDTIHRGNEAEAAVLRRLVSAGIHVLVPFGGGLSFDLGAIVPPDGRFLRIQVKSGRVRKGCVEFNTCSTDHGSGPQRYDGRADLIAVHLPGPDALFMVPVETCPVSKGNLRLDEPRNNQRRRVRFAADFEFSAWMDSLTASASTHADRDHLRHPPPEGPSADPGRLRRAAGGG